MADRQQGRRAARVTNLTPLWIALLWLAVAGLLYLAFRGIPLAQVSAVLGRLRAWQIAVLALFNFAILWVMTMRWWLMLRSLGRPVALIVLLRYRLVGFSFSYFTPGPQLGGEPLLVHLLYSRSAVPLPTAISSVTIDRLVDLLGNLTFLVIGSLVLFAGHGQSGILWVGAFALLLFPLLHLAALWRGRRPATRLLSWLAARLRSRRLFQAAALAGQSEDQLVVLLRERSGALLWALAVTALVWVGIVGEYTLTLRFLGVDPTAGEAISALTAARLAFLLPTPGGLGALEASQSLAARWMGWEPAAGIAASLLIRTRDVFMALVGAALGAVSYRDVLVKNRVPKERS